MTRFKLIDSHPDSEMDETETSFCLPAGEMRVRSPRAVKEHVSFLFSLLKFFTPADAREYFEFRFGTYSYTKVEKECKLLPPTYRKAISSEYKLYPERDSKPPRSYPAGIRDGAKQRSA